MEAYEFILYREATEIPEIKFDSNQLLSIAIYLQMEETGYAKFCLLKHISISLIIPV